LAFTGSDSGASARAFDKVQAKRLVERAGVRCPAEVALPVCDEAETARRLSALVQAHGRAVAKPVAGGSSVGLHHLRSLADVGPAAASIARSGDACLAEEFIDGTELTVGVVEGPQGTRALPCSEVRLDAGRAFDFEGKYLGKGTTEITPAQVSLAVAEAAQRLARTAHEAIGCAGYTRTDLIVTTTGPVFLETNTLPGLTRASFIPQQLRAEGTAMADFLAGQLALARARRDGRVTSRPAP
jgi:D-alanine-D-alanine ligase